MKTENIFDAIPHAVQEELLEQIITSKSIRIERIISSGQHSPKGDWYDQDEHEWVIILQGSARLLFDGDEDAVFLKQGDYVNIPAHIKHRVEWTSDEPKTVWLAIFY